MCTFAMSQAVAEKRGCEKLGANLGNYYISSAIQIGIPIAGAPQQRYTGNAFDASQNGAGSASNSYEFTAFTAADTLNRTYIRILLTVNADINNSTAGTACSVGIKIETKKTAGAYVQFQSVTVQSKTFDTGAVAGVRTLEFFYPMTADEIANGCQVKITGSASVQTSGVSTLANIESSLALC